MTTRAPFRRAHLSAALRAAQLAGLPVEKIEIGPDGKIVVFAAKPSNDSGESSNEWDAVK
jgi:hypothetical protein